MSGKRRTAFPRVKILNINITEHRAGGESSFNFVPVTKHDTEKIKKRIMEVSPTGKDLVYELEVNALTAWGAEGTARAYVRAVNPFNFEVMRVTEEPEKLSGSMYRVSIAVSH